MAEEKTKVLETEAKPSFLKKVLGFLKDNKSAFIPYAGLLVCIVIFAIVPPITTGRTLFTTQYLNDFIGRAFTLFIISLGAIFVYSTGSMDISIGAMAGVTSIVMVKIANSSGSILLGALVAIAITVVCGAINATIGEALHLPAVIGSIFLMFFAGGIQSLIFKGAQSFPLNIDVSKLDNSVIRFVIVVIWGLITFYLFKYTKLGKYTRAIGTNHVVARQAGVNVWLYKVIAYGYLGIAVIIGVLFETIRSTSVTSATGGSYHMNIMLALILGGMPLSGGMKSRVSAAIIGTIVFYILDTGLAMCGVTMDYVPFVKAVILFVLIAVTCRKKTNLLQR